MNICIIWKPEEHELPAGGYSEFSTPYLPDGEWNEWRCQFEQDRAGTAALVLRHLDEGGGSKIVHRWLATQNTDLATYLSSWLPHHVAEIRLDGMTYWEAPREEP